MSKHNNNTTDHFKVGGTGHSGENVLHELNESQYAQAEKAKDGNSLIPNKEDQYKETPAPGGDQSTIC